MAQPDAAGAAQAGILDRARFGDSQKKTQQPPSRRSNQRPVAGAKNVLRRTLELDLTVDAHAGEDVLSHVVVHVAVVKRIQSYRLTTR